VCRGPGFPQTQKGLFCGDPGEDQGWHFLAGRSGATGELSASTWWYLLWASAASAPLSPTPKVRTRYLYLLPHRLGSEGRASTGIHVASAVQPSRDVCVPSACVPTPSAFLASAFHPDEGSGVEPRADVQPTDSCSNPESLRGARKRGREEGQGSWGSPLSAFPAGPQPATCPRWGIRGRSWPQR
jgi:hypothetical protein